jgi:hypothetical protein
MTKDELTKALEEYPEKLRNALLRQFQASVKLDEARADERVSWHRHVVDDFTVERAKIAHTIRTNPSAYGLTKPNDNAIQEAVLASDEYAQLRIKWKELQGNDTDTRDASILKAREEKELSDIEVEVLQRTLETYRILADIMK